jgi:hypothetical protein
VASTQEEKVKQVKSLTIQECMQVARDYGLVGMTESEAVKTFKFHKQSSRRVKLTFGGLGEKDKDILDSLGNGEYRDGFVQDLYTENGTKIIFKDWVGKDPLLQSYGFLSPRTLDVYCQRMFGTPFREYVTSEGGNPNNKLVLQVNHAYIAQFIELLIKTKVQPSRAIGEPLQTALNQHYLSLIGDVWGNGPFEWDHRADEAFGMFVRFGMHIGKIYCGNP